MGWGWGGGLQVKASRVQREPAQRCAAECYLAGASRLHSLHPRQYVRVCVCVCVCVCAEACDSVYVCAEARNCSSAQFIDGTTGGAVHMVNSCDHIHCAFRAGMYFCWFE